MTRQIPKNETILDISLVLASSKFCLLALLTASTQFFKANMSQVTNIRRVSSNDAQPYSKGDGDSVGEESGSQSRYIEKEMV